MFCKMAQPIAREDRDDTAVMNTCVIAVVIMNHNDIGLAIVCYIRDGDTVRLACVFVIQDLRGGEAGRRAQCDVDVAFPQARASR